MSINIKESFHKIPEFFKKCGRVWHLLKKPSKEEFLMIAKVSAIGILAIGLIGFLVSLLMRMTLIKS